MFDSSEIHICLNTVVTLKRASESDFDFINNIDVQEMDNIVPRAWDWRNWHLDLAKAIRGALNLHKVFIIMVKNLSVGYIWMNEEFNSLWITAIVIESSWQRLGIGQKIINFLINECRNEGKDYIELGVQHNNQVALQFYTKLGFEKFDHVRSANTDLLRLRL